MIPSIKAMVEGYPMIIDSATVKQINALCKKILPKASPELKKDIETIATKLNDGTLLNEIEKVKTESCD